MAIKDLIPRSWGRRMTPIFDDPNPIAALQRQMNGLMEEFVSGFGFEPGTISAFNPRINVSEDKEKIYVSAELPGLSDKDVEVTLTKDSLSIRGEKREEFEEHEGRSRYRAERTYGCFQRTIPLHVEVEEDNIDAVFKDGVLNITLAKTRAAQEQAKKIPIRNQ